MPDASPHIPVLLQPILTHLAPISGVWLDGTLGAGGYARELLRAGVDQLIGVDRDPLALDMARDWGAEFGERLRLVQGNFARLDAHAGQPLDGVVLDLGVSSMQLDLPERGFSFGKDGPLDMRMSQSGPSARDIVNGASESALADILFHYGEERASRRIARAILRARAEAPIERTGQLAQIVAGCLPRPKPGQIHPATRSFQGLRIAVNAEFDALIDGLEAAERALKPGGKLAVVSFHSLEDRVVKRFLAQRAAQGGGGNRFAPEAPQVQPRFRLIEKKGIAADEAELRANPRARSARLRLAQRTDAPAGPADRAALGLPRISEV
ncbi:MAG: 16S rRNA (cytosine(1402)-N(4))-methyltransferase RsmH [Alphaproteobacteria bacterium]|jgi:16S rRNA (cytosine1402-N4)-methyltransferase|nr:16S rRNA (cytosine(1402)-N(4))-methyltransferase RsmH [Alphaproteobacteria bacterium]